MLRNPPYLNKNEIDFYFDQINRNSEKITKSKKTIEFSLSGPKYSQTFEADKKNSSTLKKLDILKEYLTQNNQIESGRLISWPWERTVQFFHEKVTATKLFFPKSNLAEIHGLHHLVVWVSEPEYSVLSERSEKWDVSGSFLYLIETLYDTGIYKGGFLSGCSALQALANIVTNSTPIIKSMSPEFFGRHNNQHPIEKLESIGAVNIGERDIETIYRLRYMTDEQCFTHNDGILYRCHDILGYPLFIDAK
ncbi:MAG: hypothetical protein P0Y53_06690 [Candidatus Pseudobacter hemicellulosilyticus]|uniref:Uncharacterized protein n=1 Tax=Candidatus Pseudobacter hemicellulosilyticus TaxID=3121375 RepID=A0AAJ5WV44_9BACT|nr:MAG: hypothetical protein P0Y53_06690 [Pseudobacter sp.]